MNYRLIGAFAFAGMSVVGVMTAGAAQQQVFCPIWAPADPTVDAVNRLCADNARIVRELNAKLKISNECKSEQQRTTDFLNSVYGEKDPEKLKRMAARWEAIGRMADSEIQSAQRERERMAWNEKNRADQEFRNSTGREFSQTIRPSTPGAYQDAWDRCNRTHQIWND